MIDFSADGKGVAFGKAGRRPNAIEIGMEIYDRFDTQIRNGFAYYVSGGADIDTTLEELVLTDKNTPTIDFYFIQTMFYADKSETAHRAQTAIPYNTNNSMYHRYYFNGSWSVWRRHVNADESQKLLWSGAWYMNENQTINLPENVSKQKAGIVLIFSEYAGGVLNSSFHCRFVPKSMSISHNGSAQCIQLSTSNLAYFATKYLYILDNKIAGHSNNDISGTGACGIKYTNNRFVLRYVLGV